MGGIKFINELVIQIRTTRMINVLQFFYNGVIVFSSYNNNTLDISNLIHCFLLPYVTIFTLAVSEHFFSIVQRNENKIKFLLKLYPYGVNSWQALPRKQGILLIHVMQQ